MKNTIKKRNLKLNQLFNSNLSIEQVLNKVLEEDVDFAYFFVFSTNSINNKKTEYFERNKTEIKNNILNIISTKKLSFDKLYNLILIYFEDDFDCDLKEFSNMKINEKNIKLLRILLDMEVKKDDLERNLSSLAKLIN